MSHTNATTNYALSQFVSTDTPAWMTDVNGDNQKIDAALHSNAEAASANATAIAATDTKVSNFLPDTGSAGNILKRTTNGASWQTLDASEIAYDPTGTVLPSNVTNVGAAIEFVADSEILIREVRTNTVTWSASTPGTHAGQCEASIESITGYSPVFAIVDGLSTSVSCIIGTPVLEPTMVKCPLYRANNAAGSEWLNIKIIYKKV